jgi:hypothetical protein
LATAVIWENYLVPGEQSRAYELLMHGNLTAFCFHVVKAAWRRISRHLWERNSGRRPRPKPRQKSSREKAQKSQNKRPERQDEEETVLS